MAGMKQVREEWRRADRKAEALNPATPKMIARAKKLGKEGYLAGKKAPAQDAKIIAMCHNRPHNTMMKLMTAWNEGWHTEHQKQTDMELAKKGIIMPRMKSKRSSKKR